MKELALQKWFLQDALGRFLWTQEAKFFQAAWNGGRVHDGLFLGQISRLWLPETMWHRSVVQARVLPADVLADDAHLPWREESFDAVLAAHLPDTCENWSMVLAQLFDVLQPQGRVVLTGFNPYSLWRLWRGTTLPDVRDGVSYPRVCHVAQSMGWHVSEGRFIHHLPPFRQPENWQLMEYAGRYLWTQSAAVYALVLSKRVVHIQPCTQDAPFFDFSHTISWGMARLSDD